MIEESLSNDVSALDTQTSMAKSSILYYSTRANHNQAIRRS